MRKKLLSLSLVDCLCASIVGMVAPPAATAGDVPVREFAALTNTTPSVIVMPAFQGNGQLLGVQVTDDRLTNNTLVVKHRIPVPGTARALTNTVVTMVYTLTAGSSIVLTNGPHYSSGDSFLYQFGTSSTGLVNHVRSIVN